VMRGMSWLEFFGFLLGGVACLLSRWVAAVRTMGGSLPSPAQRRSASSHLWLSFTGAIAFSVASFILLLRAGEAPQVFRHGFAFGFFAAGLWGAFLANLLPLQASKKNPPSLGESR